MSRQLADTVSRPVRISKRYVPKKSKIVPLSKIPRDDREPRAIRAAAASYTYHSGLEGENYIIIEIGDIRGAGTTADKIMFMVGDSFRINLLGGSAYFVAGAALKYNLPGSNPDGYKKIKADAWDSLRLRFSSPDAILIHRVMLMKSSETLLDARVDDWLDKYSKSVIDLSLQTAMKKWEAVGKTRVTALFYAGQDLGQTGSRKYVKKDVRWCSEFASHMIRKNGLRTPRGSITTGDMKKFFSKRDRLYLPADVESTKYTIRPGDYMSINDGGHSVLFREWVGGAPAPGTISPNKQFYTIEGNVANMVRLQVRKWKHVDAIGNAQ
jgi:hypothetical protein